MNVGRYLFKCENIKTISIADLIFISTQFFQSMIHRAQYLVILVIFWSFPNPFLITLSEIIFVVAFQSCLSDHD
jgi:hypothetical protein